MTMSIETLAALLDDELVRAIERLKQSRREMKADIAALRAERARRKERRKERRR
jgi:hypothetical protein